MVDKAAHGAWLVVQKRLVSKVVSSNSAALTVPSVAGALRGAALDAQAHLPLAVLPAPAGSSNSTDVQGHVPKHAQQQKIQEQATSLER